MGNNNNLSGVFLFVFGDNPSTIIVFIDLLL